MSKPVPTIEVLRAARKLVANEETWCKGSFARNSDGEPTGTRWSDAKSFCVSGAISVACDSFGLDGKSRDPLYEALRVLAHNMYGVPWLHVANDNLGRLAALSIIDAAIAELGEKP